ncbi:hypothetical protein AYI69_g2982 [Smittium culicis]|uniref:Uncharacterized protein n=1 Tax=Smittium culicis TaxID=133412 RepID=A0A1R1YKW6_9FUNG|nr:hypothetical protein AYI69_g2982 [Smittium culicis]
MSRPGAANSSGNSNILGDLPNFFMRVPIVSNVGSLSYGLVSGVAGTGMRAAAGVYDAREAFWSGGEPVAWRCKSSARTVNPGATLIAP